MARRTDWRAIAGDGLLALLIGCVMTAGWAWRDWPLLSALHLPDTDDMMRLQQIRDWLAGQPFRDLAQHRLGVDGLAMHWSRLPDLVPGGIIATLAPSVGRHQAELAAVILWPALLFVAALWLIAAIARRIDGGTSARTALIVAAIGYPVTTLFLPGRIDHHGFQIVLLLAIVRLLLAAPRRSTGAAIGLAATASIVIGLETAPFLLVAAALIWLGWARGASDGRMLGFGLGFGLSLAFASVFFASDGWTYPACDGFTRLTWSGAQLAAFAPVVLALIGQGTASPRLRIGASGLVGLGLVVALLPVAERCANPYGAVDPMLARLWLAHVGEAQPLLLSPLATAIGYAGLLVIGLIASLWCWLRGRGRGWGVIVAFQLAALALTGVQLRGAYAGAALAAPALAVLIGIARRHGSGWLAGAWLASAGMLYPIAAEALVPSSDPAGTAAATGGGPTAIGGGCSSPAVLARLAALPAGTIIAPVDVGAYAIGMTRHRMIAAPYHRNNAGNAAMYRFFLGDRAGARAIARATGATYVLLCATSFAELDPALVANPNALLSHLKRRDFPAWLRPADAARDGAIILRVQPGL
ncbi:MAG: hypothetical protein B7Y43_01140 [Sphingomonas sp. 28-62-20]|uniref:hypothetical protein n=1 Tax=Sphingomonas sp. 28-62-20 TaxID=1970433 RepID=UPI000BC4154C|nr:MAG: hypothetical protein B7Y43_01140 [Sphingomonas sp. 28-62-20]